MRIWGAIVELGEILRWANLDLGLGLSENAVRPESGPQVVSAPPRPRSGRGLGLQFWGAIVANRGIVRRTNLDLGLGLSQKRHPDKNGTPSRWRTPEA